MPTHDANLVTTKLKDIFDKIPSSTPDIMALGARQRLDEEKEKLAIQRLQAQLDNLKSSINLSSKLTIGVFAFVLLWIMAVFGFLVFQALLPLPQRLATSILVTLLTTTTVNILGLLYLVIKYVFDHRLQA